ncbi:DUF7124 domain-containing protein [Halorubrum lacusprofundi]|jgi:hypothetical protein|uniref:DUF7124 domain-containing protein n=1 Tax=Halorubrum lacusprofundi (strain ATCC 49239 / DSM 5036 / JCM 8891 / ACAM 34) TaxID=416348 RepID=B9LR38_HALLT|nr:hypothetical protein [Halorubrum lacusprofundi]ACM57692.1 conserved hypothetical protein [Halorubrum lacusprofundi ATCC 49239]MCG1005712.1 hypothetical protein [Halorubrum lacusprofundi]
MGIDIDDPDPGDRTGDVTLVFSLGAARRLSDPEAAIANARKWSRHVGIVANDADAVERFVRETGVENDYTLRNWDKWGTLGDIHEESGAPRAVFVGASTANRRVATHVGFEYLPIDEAAEKAGWALSEPERSSESGVISRLWRALRARLD